MHKKIYQKKWIALTVIAGMFLWVLLFIKTTDIPEKAEVEVQPALFTLEQSALMPVAVSGVVVASDTVIVRAQTPGTIDRILVQEGDTVSQGQLLVAQDASVLAQSIVLQEAQAGLQVLSQEATVAAKESMVDKTHVLYNTAMQAELLKQTDTSARIAEAVQLLLTNMEGVTVGIASTLDFLDNNRSYMTSRGFDLYLKTVTQLYDGQPNQLTGGVVYHVQNKDDILRQLDVLQKMDTPDVDAVLALASLLDQQLTSLQTLLAYAEVDFFDQSQVGYTSTLYATYLTHREAMVSVQADLRTMKSALTASLDALPQIQLAQQTNTSVASVDTQSAEEQKQYAQQIASQTDVVTQAQLGVLKEQYALTQNKAPFSGVVTDVLVDKGAYVQPGSALLTLSGVSGYELQVTVPADMLSLLQIGQSFVVDDEVLGTVSRFSPTVQQGSVTVFIQLLDDTVTAGDVLSGTIMLDGEDASVFMMPRAYIHFRSSGPMVVTQSGTEYSIEIIQDMSDVLYIRLSQGMTQPLVPAVSTSL